MNAFLLHIDSEIIAWTDGSKVDIFDLNQPAPHYKVILVHCIEIMHLHHCKKSMHLLDITWWNSNCDSLKTSL